jgi:hypothetical protein
MIVARHEMPGKAASRSPSRRVRYESVAEGITLSGDDRQPLAPRITPFPTGRIMSADLPGISCLATIISSLRDKGYGLSYVDERARPRDFVLKSLAFRIVGVWCAHRDSTPRHKAG